MIQLVSSDGLWKRVRPRNYWYLGGNADGAANVRLLNPFTAR